MAPIVALILGKILDYLGDHVDEVINAIKEQFLSVSKDPNLMNAVQELGYSPTEENLNKVHDILKVNGEDTDKLAKILVNATEVA